MVTVAVHLPLGALLVMGCGGLVWACPAQPERQPLPLPPPIPPTRRPPADRNESTTCTPGYYGANCMIECGYCLENEPCDPYTGYCTVPCQPNFLEPLCQQLLNCSYQRYGRLCEQECGNCAGNVTCNYTNGHCKSCQKGWTPPLCQTEERCPFLSDQGPGIFSKSLVKRDAHFSLTRDLVSPGPGIFSKSLVKRDAHFSDQGLGIFSKSLVKRDAHFSLTRDLVSPGPGIFSKSLVKRDAHFSDQGPGIFSKSLVKRDAHFSLTRDLVSPVRVW
ncbi:hypothetical protein ACOMHN_018496 [Nucella lapillus]